MASHSASTRIPDRGPRSPSLRTLGEELREQEKGENSREESAPKRELEAPEGPLCRQLMSPCEGAKHAKTCAQEEQGDSSPSTEAAEREEKACHTWSITPGCTDSCDPTAIRVANKG